MMISVIVSSGNPENFDRLSTSLSKSIGISYELIKIDNPGTMGICKAYNNGAAKAQYDILCFVHDDVRFVTQDWGPNLLSYFRSDENIGVLGVAGSTCKSRMPASWWQPAVNNVEPKRCNLVQHFKHTAKDKEHNIVNPCHESKSIVAALDGVFLAMKKEVWSEHKFDEKLLKGFHGYDIDISLNIGKKRNNYVVYDILLEHASEGQTGLSWFESIFKVHRKWKSILPVVKKGDVGAKELKVIDRYWFDHLLSIKVDKKDRGKKLGLSLQLLPLLGWKNITMNDIKRYKTLLQRTL